MYIYTYINTPNTIIYERTEKLISNRIYSNTSSFFSPNRFYSIQNASMNILTICQDPAHVTKPIFLSKLCKRTIRILFPGWYQDVFYSFAHLNFLSCRFHLRVDLSSPGNSSESKLWFSMTVSIATTVRKNLVASGAATKVYYINLSYICGNSFRKILTTLIYKNKVK